MPDRIIRWATRGRIRFGTKQIALLALGVLGTIRGVSYIEPPKVPAGLRTLDQVLPMTAWGVLWVLIGVVAIGGAFTRHYRMPFVPLMVMTALWGASYIAEWGMDFFARSVDSRDYITAVSYAVQALLILVVIRLIDPAEVQTERGPDD